MVDLHHSLWSTHDVNVVEEGHEVLIREQTFSQSNQGSVLTHREQSGYERVALFASFSLDNLVCRPRLVVPQIPGGCAVELGHEGEH